MDFSLSSFLGHLDKEQMAESTRNDNQKVISNDVSIILILKVVLCSILLIQLFFTLVLKMYYKQLDI